MRRHSETEWDRLTREIVETVQTVIAAFERAEKALDDRTGLSISPSEFVRDARRKLDQCTNDMSQLTDPDHFVKPNNHDVRYYVPLLATLQRLVSATKVYFRAMEGFFMTHDEDPAVLHDAILRSKSQLIDDFTLLRTIVDHDPRPISSEQARASNSERDVVFRCVMETAVNALTELNARMPPGTDVGSY